MKFPEISQEQRLRRLEIPSGVSSMVLDTDTYNEVDDQFAIIYSMLAEQIDVKAVIAAPFFNQRSDGPADGMEKSYEEILRTLELIDADPVGMAYRGSSGYLPDRETPVESEGARRIVELAHEHAGDDPLYVLAIGAFTNVASALLMDPSIINKIVVMVLGGNPHHWHSVKEFNLQQDIPAGQVIFDSGVPLVQIPGLFVSEFLQISVEEAAVHLKGKGRAGAYLYNILKEYREAYDGGISWTKAIWDIAGPIYLINANWLDTRIVHTPVITDQGTYSFDTSRHFMRVAQKCARNVIFNHMFETFSKLVEEKEPAVV